LTKVLKSAYQTITAEAPLIEASPWATDGGLLSHAGGTPVIVFGPGETKMAHQANEYIEKDALIQSAKIISLFIMNWCDYER
ncbi:M20/M25/M40 family metallo-hydrolase, partial [Bacillus licheniformis]|uniref:M20/M25/M40 family metallo-hydrolase n=1 Tax=Bacillus licheniformis TaxID=1402 RepID=UPI002E239525